MSIKDQFRQAAPESIMNPTDGFLTYKRRESIVRWIGHGFLGMIVFVILFPIYWTFASALRPRSVLYNPQKPLIPSLAEITLKQYELVFTNTNVLTYYKNSLIIAGGVVLITTIAATLGGYGLARQDIPKKKVFARMILFGYMFPSIVISIPMFIYWRQLGIINTYMGVILAESAKALPFGLWLMWQFFQTVPESLEESARVSGATRFESMYEIAIPVAKPGIIAVAIFAYAASWDEFTIPKVLLPNSDLWPLTVGLTVFTQQTQTFWGQLMAATSLVVLPAFFFVFFLQKYMLKGFKM